MLKITHNPFQLLDRRIMRFSILEPTSSYTSNNVDVNRIKTQPVMFDY